MSAARFDANRLMYLNRVESCVKQHFAHSTVRATLSNLFQAVQDKLGVSVTPLHFYFPVPNIKSLARKNWCEPRNFGAFDYRVDEQVVRMAMQLLDRADGMNSHLLLES